MEPELVAEVGVDVARDASGRWRHPARLHRARPDLSPADVPHLTLPPRDAQPAEQRALIPVRGRAARPARAKAANRLAGAQADEDVPRVADPGHALAVAVRGDGDAADQADPVDEALQSRLAQDAAMAAYLQVLARRLCDAVRLDASEVGQACDGQLGMQVPAPAPAGSLLECNSANSSTSMPMTTRSWCRLAKNT
ncbi:MULTISPECIES: hypothetical protein [unclassified Streptomyces]|uniref:hypothetical protein n=1 Tax=unclassified Streptomyces TaxID=2593676 RepID=UPI0040433F24